MYNGQAKLKLYEDTSCTKEIRLSPTGEYILNARIVTGHASGTYNKNIYIKNVGSHSAYNISVTKLTDTSSEATIQNSFSTLPSNARKVIKVSIPYTKGDRNTIRISMKVDYDNIP